MKTGLIQQRELVLKIQTSSLIVGIKELREWLRANEYEDDGPCPHTAVFRVTGKCTACSVIPGESDDDRYTNGHNIKLDFTE